MKKYTFYSGLFLLAVLFSSCEKVIDLDLNSKDPKIVIEGNIDDQAGPYYVRISTSINFDQSNDFPPVTAAQVIINDSQSGPDTLTEIEPGLYRSNTLQGVYGHTYTLSVLTAEGESYTAVSTMPQLVNFDDLTVDSLIFFGATTYTFTPTYQDPGVTGNRYRFIVHRNFELQDDIVVFDDKLNNGLVNTRPVVVNTEWMKGDTATIEMRNIDSPVYDYFYSLQISEDGGTAAPSNPLSNISNGALGYFSAHTTQTRKVTIP